MVKSEPPEMPYSRIRLCVRGVMGRFCAVSFTRVTVLSAISAAMAKCASLPIFASASAGGTRDSRAALCSPSEALRARIRRSASCSRASVMTPDL
ncbi:hypothetical protein SRABI128_03394 [Microbacterium sp. Bi128]|nr:hypothetical protein SRABI128_03394 [Microbacterium sp. Bi128]